jgi:hypothetical protein
MAIVVEANVVDFMRSDHFVNCRSEPGEGPPF